MKGGETVNTAVLKTAALSEALVGPTPTART